MILAGSRILVTGGAHGRGRVFALDLAAAGTRVGACDMAADGLADLEREATAGGLSVWTQQADVSDEASVERLCADFVAQSGGIDAVVNDAGLNRDGLLIKKTGETFERLPLASGQAVIDVDLTGVFLCAREAAFHMASQGTGGVIVNGRIIPVDGELRL